MQRVALYHRVSTVDQNPDAARRELEQAAMRHGFRTVLQVEETGSGASNDRPGLRRIMRAAKRGELDVVIVWKLDRFGRSALDLLAQLRELDACGVRFIAITQGIDLKAGGDAMSRLLLTMLAAVAEFERDLIRDRTRMGLARAREKGAQLGRPRVALPPIDRVLRCYQPYFTQQEVADRLGVSRHAIREALRICNQKRGEKRGGKRPPRNPGSSAELEDSTSGRQTSLFQPDSRQE